MNSQPHAHAPHYSWDDKPRPEDVHAVRGLIHSTGVFSSEEVRIAGELIEENLSGNDADYAFVFARMGRKLAGYACFGEIPLTENRYDLYWIAVNPALRGAGVGLQLLRRVEHRIRNSGGAKMYVETSGREDYEPARQFYLKHGFFEAARLPEFYRRGDDKIIYAKNL